jgi:hypothetical protein
MTIRFTGPEDEDWKLVEEYLGEMIDVISTDTSL